MQKTKFFRQTISLVFLLVMSSLLLFGAESVSAETTSNIIGKTSVIDIAQGESISIDSKNQCYRIDLPNNGYIMLTFTAEDKDAFSADIYFYRKLSDYGNISKAINWSELEGDHMTLYLALNKGVYYLDLEPYFEDGLQVKLKYNFYKNNPGTNYCRLKAKTVAAGKKTTICINNGYEFDRWYKIKLDSKKRITVTYKDLDYNGDMYPVYCKLYDSAGKMCSCERSEIRNADGSYTYKIKTKALPKGKYYFRVVVDESNAYNAKIGRILFFSWK